MCPCMFNVKFIVLIIFCGKLSSMFTQDLNKCVRKHLANSLYGIVD